jgi:hypothetical protein
VAPNPCHQPADLGQLVRGERVSQLKHSRQGWNGGDQQNAGCCRYLEKRP